MRATLWIFIILSGLAFPALAAKPLVADLSQYRIAIDSGFTGTRLLLFGSRNDSGDIVVVVHGPERTFTVRRKERIAGIWVNRDQERFDRVPTYYAIASSRPFDSLKATAMFKPLRIGLGETVTPVPEGGKAFAAALIRYEQDRGLYSAVPQQVSFMGESLFKLVIPFPDTISGGDYSADIYLFSDGELMGMQSIPIHVEKIGFDAFVSEFARDHAVIYGVFAVVLAIAIGWGASSLFLRRI